MSDTMFAVMAALGYALQWAKSPKSLPTWVAYSCFGGLAVLAFVWATPGVEQVIHDNWRHAVEMFVAFLLGIEGVSAVSRKSGLAPKTDSK